MGTHIKEIIKDYINNKDRHLRKGVSLENILKKHLGEQVAAGVVFAGIKDEVMYLSSQASAFSYYFRLKKKHILEDVKKEFPETKEIKIKVC